MEEQSSLLGSDIMDDEEFDIINFNGINDAEWYHVRNQCNFHTMWGTYDEFVKEYHDTYQIVSSIKHMGW